MYSGVPKVENANPISIDVGIQSLVKISKIKRKVSDGGKVIDQNGPQWLQARAERAMSLNT